VGGISNYAKLQAKPPQRPEDSREETERTRKEEERLVKTNQRLIGRKRIGRRYQKNENRGLHGGATWRGNRATWRKQSENRKESRKCRGEATERRGIAEPLEEADKRPE
jgi:hypothetical protein